MLHAYVAAVCALFVSGIGAHLFDAHMLDEVPLGAAPSDEDVTYPALTADFLPQRKSAFTSVDAVKAKA